MTDWALPQKGIFVTGTDTEVGKTWVSAQLLQALITHKRKVKSAQSDKNVFFEKGGDPLPCARKPVASGATSTFNGKLLSEDTRILAEQTGESSEIVTRYTFAAPVAPSLAAQNCGIDMPLEQLLCACHAPANRWTLVEGAGGFYSPMGSDGSLNADLAKHLSLPVLLVVGLKLGCVNHTLLTLEAIQQHGLHCIGVILNDLHNTQDTQTATLLTQCIQAPFYQMPYKQPDATWQAWVANHLNL